MGALVTGLLIMATVTHAVAAADFSKCGSPVVSGRIVGGTDSVDGEWPWQVSLQYNGRHYCGGSLIAPQWVMSAGHCFMGIPIDAIYNVTVYLGLNKLGVNTSHTIAAKIQNIYVHPSDIEGDISLVQLTFPVTYTQYIMPICLPSKSSVSFPCGMECWVTGWGARNYGDYLIENGTLQKVMTPLIDYETCNEMYLTGLGINSSLPFVEKQMICSGYRDGQKGSCQGDSGGPLVCKVKDVWYQVGIVSWGIGCAEPNFPSVYTYVPVFEDWMKVPLKGQVTFKTITCIPPATRECGGYYNTSDIINVLSLANTCKEDLLSDGDTAIGESLYQPRWCWMVLVIAALRQLLL